MLDEANYKIDENNSLLILDDDQPFLKRLSVAMEKRGFNVFPASSMAEFSRIIDLFFCQKVELALTLISLQDADSSWIDIPLLGDP